MQEIFENMLKDAYDQMIKDRDEAKQIEMINTTDVVALLKHVKLQRALAENHRLGLEKDLAIFLSRKTDASEEHVEDELVREASDFSRIVETMDWFIDMIEAGKFIKPIVKKYPIGSMYKDYCYSCHNKTQQKLIAYNKYDNPVYECMDCGSFSVDKIYDQDGDAF